MADDPKPVSDLGDEKLIADVEQFLYYHRAVQTSPLRFSRSGCSWRF
jgi:hypothetical protein